MIYNTIVFILQFPNINLVISEHPTTAMEYNYEADLESESNLNILRGEVPSSSLLNWGDLFLDVGSSIAYGAIQRNKPVFDLDYLHSNSLMYSELMPSLRIETMDELLYNVSQLVENSDAQIYDQKKREKFLNSVICPSGKVLENYVELLTAYK